MRDAPGWARWTRSPAWSAVRAAYVCSALLASAPGCGDDGIEGDVEPVAEPGFAPDATILPRIKVTNAGAPCVGHETCSGDLPQCLITSPAGTIYFGGYCTADCKSSAECGPGAECPVGEAEIAEPDYAFTSTWARKCFKACTPGKGECRVGYECKSLADAYRAHDAPAPMHHTVCVPYRGSLFGADGGAASDAGATREAGSRPLVGAPQMADDAGTGAARSALSEPFFDAGRRIETFRSSGE